MPFCKYRCIRFRHVIPDNLLHAIQVASMIRWLTSPNPAQRPTAAEVLRSDILPPLVGDEQLKVGGPHSLGRRGGFT